MKANIKSMKKFRKTMEKQIDNNAREQNIFQPLLTAGQIYNISFYEQNFYNPVELDAIYRVLKIAFYFVCYEEKKFDKNMKKLPALIEQLDQMAVAASSEQKNLSESQLGKPLYAAKAKKQLVKHLRALHALFQALQAAFHLNSVEQTLKALNSPHLIKNGKFRTLYALTATNIIAYLNLQAKNSFNAVHLLSGALANKPKPHDPLRVLDTGFHNAQLNFCVTSFNLAVAQIESGLYESGITTL